MIGNIYKLKEDGTPWQVIAEGVFAKGSQDVWPEVVVMQLLEPPYPVVVMEKGDSRLAGMEYIYDGQSVLMAANRRAELRKKMAEMAERAKKDS